MTSSLDTISKGLPHVDVAPDVASLAERKWNLLAEDLPLPVAILKRSSMEANRAAMMAFIREVNAELAPHGKTTMSPEIFRMQIDDGAWGITLSTVPQVRVALAAGVRRVLLANQLVCDQDLDYIVQRLATDDTFDFYCFVDSVELVERWARAAARHDLQRPVQLLVELGYAGGRAGCRDPDTALTVAEAVATRSQLSLRGIAGFEGLHQYLSADEAEPLIAHYLDFICDVTERCDARRLLEGADIILTAGGSAFFDMVAARFGELALSKPVKIVLRSGCYVTHDSGIYERHQPSRMSRTVKTGNHGPELSPALEVWAYVTSIPEPGRAILGAGRRDFGHDAGPPRPLAHFRPGQPESMRGLSNDHEIVAINDQHAHLAFADPTSLAVGDMIALGISHPCTTFDRWRSMVIVDDEYTVVSAITTRF
jgi:D-serine dehydratase